MSGEVVPRSRQPKRDLDEYVIALEKGLHFCAANPEPYTDWEYPPSQEEAEEMCLPCPMYAICRENANWRKPKWNVYGGIAWIEGRQAHLMTEDEILAAVSVKD